MGNDDSRRDSIRDFLENHAGDVSPEFGPLLAAELNGVEQIHDASDLPDPVNGFHQLEDKMYAFFGHVESDDGLEMQPGTVAPLLGHHREHCWFVHTGEGTAIKARDTDVLASDIGINAPGGTVFDIDGTEESEFYLDSVYVADDQQRANIADLGTVGTFRGPGLRKVGLRDFDAGLTLDGSYGRFYVESTVRDVTSAGVTIFDFTENMEANAVDFTNCDFSDLQADTEVVRVDQNATIHDVFLYEGNSHHVDTVTKENIFNGKADPAVVPFWVDASFPVRNSAIIGQVSLDSGAEVEITTQNEWVEVAGSTSEGDDIQRVSGDGEGGAEYIGRKDSNVDISIAFSWYGANGSEYEFGIAKNGAVEPSTALPAEGGGQNANLMGMVTGVEDLSTGDKITLMVRNTDGTGNVTFTRSNIKFVGA